MLPGRSTRNRDQGLLDFKIADWKPSLALVSPSCATYSH